MRPIHMRGACINIWTWLNVWVSERHHWTIKQIWKKKSTRKAVGRYVVAHERAVDPIKIEKKRTFASTSFLRMWFPDRFLISACFIWTARVWSHEIKWITTNKCMWMRIDKRAASAVVRKFVPKSSSQTLHYSISRHLGHSNLNFTHETSS